jgi:hypothetical protein
MPTKTKSRASAGKKPARKTSAARKPAAGRTTARKKSTAAGSNRTLKKTAPKKAATRAKAALELCTGGLGATTRRTRSGGDNWRPAKSLVKLWNQVKAKFPGRKNGSDGMIGDRDHAKRHSDHNPHVDWDGREGVVTALDLTHDKAGGCDCQKLIDAIVAARDSRVKYLIWNRQIANSSKIGSTAAWTWRAYGGSNPHTSHMHVSVKADRASYDNEAAWPI